MIDLHAHTTYSDGRFTPEEVVGEAARRGIRILAITDHDNARGSRLAAQLARQAGVELVPAVEITCRWDGVGLPEGDNTVDLLGYCLETGTQSFLDFEQSALQDIYERIDECCQSLSGQGYALTLADVFAENPNYAGLLQLINAMMRKGYFERREKAQAAAMAAWGTTHPTRLAVQEAIAFIHRMGGAAVLAHPVMVRPAGQRLEAGPLALLVDAGLDGLEIYHDSATPEDRAHFQHLARRYRLVETGGSDLHGWMNGFDRFGSQPLTLEMVDGLKERAALHRKKE